MQSTTDALEALAAWLRESGTVAVAVSGGVDSITLSAIAHRALGHGAQMYHAVSPAVPADATERLRRLASREGWTLEFVDAGEFEDARYRTNPVDRCYHCKRNLYVAIAQRTHARVISGANLDDLGDFRPGLRAAAEHGVRHPYVETGVDKQLVRRIARQLQLGELAELPAAPCLASRVETGIAIDATTLASVYACEKIVHDMLAPSTVRCRVRRDAIVVELDPGALARATAECREALTRLIATKFRHFGRERTVAFSPYRMGSAFLRGR